MSDRSLSMLLHAPSKVGKTTLASTSPLPLLVLDAEGGWKFIGKAGFSGEPLRKKMWNPMLEAPPRYDGTWDICRVNVTDWNSLFQTYQWLISAPHDFRGVCLDSITEMQRRLKANLRGTEQMRIQDWGDLLTRMDGLIRGYRDLTLDYDVEFVLFISETKEEKGVWGPAMQGQISRSLPYWMDLVGYLYVEQLADANGQPTEKVRKLLIGSNASFVTGERVQGVLGDIISNPNLSQMYDKVFASAGILESMKEL